MSKTWKIVIVVALSALALWAYMRAVKKSKMVSIAASEPKNTGIIPPGSSSIATSPVAEPTASITTDSYSAARAAGQQQQQYALLSSSLAN